MSLIQAGLYAVDSSIPEIKEVSSIENIISEEKSKEPTLPESRELDPPQNKPTHDISKNASPDQHEFNWNFDYDPKEIENMRLRFARNKPDGESAIEEMRLIMNYVKTF